MITWQSLSATDKGAVLDLALACPALAGNRDGVLGQMQTPIATQAARRPVARQDLLAIFQALDNYAGAWQEFIAALRLVEGDSLPVTAFVARIAQLGLVAAPPRTPPPPENPPMPSPFSLEDADQEKIRIVIQRRGGYDAAFRNLCLNGIDPSLAGQLPVHAAPGAQLNEDLGWLGTYDRLGSWDPLLQWLKNAERNTRGINGAGIFKELIDRLDNAPPPPPAPAAVTPSPKPTSLPSPARTKVFISYSHKDVAWLKRLQAVLAPLGDLDVWDDTKIQAGDLWLPAIEKALAEAKVAVLLVSIDFLASEFITRKELPPLLEATRTNGARILWVPVGNCLYEATSIGDYQAAWPPAQPLKGLSAAKRDEALTEIARKVREAMQ